GDQVTIPASQLYSGLPNTFQVTLAGDELSGGTYFAGRVLAGGKLIDGDYTFTYSPYGRGEYRLLATRCECDDGNTTDGDGCDHTCRVEPCYECTGSPSL